MRIQHNIMAMSAYRNYNTNTSAVAKNLEKLSSGYKINRAGDDAAGLAISEKMRAQITGLNAAQKNVKDGISLVKTAEGAMQEIQDMLNRMDYLATQSANGTYQDEVDREALQKEVNQLKDEIDRIADSANFNGIKLLDGSLDVKEATETIEKTTISGIRGTGLYVPNDGGTPPKDLINDNVDACVQGWGLYTHKDATGEAKTSFDVRFSNYEIEGLEEGEEVTINLSITAAPASGDIENEIAGGGIDIKVNADENGKVTGKMIADAVAKHYKDNSDGKINLTNSSGIAIEYSITSDGNSIKFEMTDKGYQDAAAAYKADATDTKNWVFDANYNVDLTTTVDRKPEFTGTGADDAAKKTDIIKQLTDAGWTKQDGTAITTVDADIDVVKNAAGQEFALKAYDNGSVKLEGTVEVGKGLTDNSTSVTKKGTAAAGTQLADGLIAPSKNGWARDEFKDGSGIKIGDTNYVFASTDETLKAKYDANTKVVDIRDLVRTEDDAGGVEKKGWLVTREDINTALHRLADAAGDNKMWSVQVSNGGSLLAIREREDYNGNGEDGRADLTTREGIEATITLFDKAKAHYSTTEASGKALQLQIGDTSDEYNRLNVSVGDMHTKALGIADLDIGTAEKAAAAIQTIKDAINNVSSVRGDLGAYQNRLEHTANNLSVMAENITDAESSIRDTDIAEEMMAYTKNNILVQSAQAMLAQANQVPQGVLQLLG